MPRKSLEKQAAHEAMISAAKKREVDFKRFYQNLDQPTTANTIVEARKAHKIIKSFMEYGYGAFDLFNLKNKGFASEDDTHAVPRFCETIFTECKIDNSKDPDLPSNEIKFKASIGPGKLKQRSNSNSLIRVGTINVLEDTFESSSCFKKMNRTLISLYDEYTGLFHESVLFILKEKNEKGELIWFNKFKEDWLFMQKELTKAVNSGKKSSSSNWVSTRTKTPNGYLRFHCNGGKNSQGIKITQKAYTAISSYYDKKITIAN